MGKYIFQAILTPEEEGGYSVATPDLPGCFSYGETYQEAVFMAADAMKTYIGSLLKHGEEVPQSTLNAECPQGCLAANIFIETDASFVIDGECVSAAEAARELGVSAGRITHMIDSGLLDAYRMGRRTYVSKESISKRKAQIIKPGRPRKVQEA